MHPKKAGKGWVTVVVPKGTLLYRGELATRSNTMLQNMSGNEPRPTWYTKELENAMSYLPFGANGNLYVYRTTKDLKMFKLDSAKNANKLFEMFHNDDVKIFPGMGRGKKAMKSKGNPMMNFLIHIYLGEYSLKRNSKSYKLINGIPQVTSDKDLKRASILPYDLAFARWLCHNGFSGYDQGKMAGKHSKVFDDEVCICLPHKNLELVDVFQFPKGVGKKTTRQGTFQTAVKNTKSRVRNAKWYKMRFKMASEDECNICFEKIPKDDNNGKGRGCPAGVCKGKFCSLCIDKWLEKNPTCPLCRGAETSANKKERKRRKKELATVKKKSKELRSRLKRSALAVAALGAALGIGSVGRGSLAPHAGLSLMRIPGRVCFNPNLQHGFSPLGPSYEKYFDYYSEVDVPDCTSDAIEAVNKITGELVTVDPSTDIF